MVDGGGKKKKCRCISEQIYQRFSLQSSRVRAGRRRAKVSFVNWGEEKKKAIYSHESRLSLFSVTAAGAVGGVNDGTAG